MFLFVQADSKGPQGKASMTVEGKMFGLTFHEQWYILGMGPDFRCARARVCVYVCVCPCVCVFVTGKVALAPAVPSFTMHHYYALAVQCGCVQG